MAPAWQCGTGAVPGDDPVVTHLEHALEEALGEPADGRIASTVPMDHGEDYSAAHAFHVKINSHEAGRSDQFNLEYVLRRARVQRAGRRTPCCGT